MDIPQLVYPFTCWWILCCFYFLLQIKLLWTLHTSLYTIHNFLFLCLWHLRIKLLDYMVCICAPVWKKSTELSSEVINQFLFPPVLENFIHPHPCQYMVCSSAFYFRILNLYFYSRLFLELKNLRPYGMYLLVGPSITSNSENSTFPISNAPVFPPKSLFPI